MNTFGCNENNAKYLTFNGKPLLGRAINNLNSLINDNQVFMFLVNRF